VRKPRSAELVVCHFDDTKTQDGPETAKRCVAEAVHLCEQLGIVLDQMKACVRRKGAADVLRLCQYEYENLLFRVYVLRERAWDILAATVGVKRGKTGDPGFRKALLSSATANHPKLTQAFNELLSLIERDVRFRNTATHQTILQLGFIFDNDRGRIFEADSVLMWHDLASKAARDTGHMVKRTVTDFVTRTTARIQGIINAALQLARECGRAHGKCRLKELLARMPADYAPAQED